MGLSLKVLFSHLFPSAAEWKSQIQDLHSWGDFEPLLKQILEDSRELFLKDRFHSLECSGVGRPHLALHGTFNSQWPAQPFDILES